MSAKRRIGIPRSITLFSLCAWAFLVIANCVELVRHRGHASGTDRFSSVGLIAIGLVIIVLDAKALLERPR